MAEAPKVKRSGAASLNLDEIYKKFEEIVYMEDSPLGMVNALFEAIDVDKCGCIQTKDVVEIICKKVQFTKKAIFNIILDTDSNFNGTMYLQDFSNLIETLRKQIKADKKAKIDLEEANKRLNQSLDFLFEAKFKEKAEELFGAIAKNGELPMKDAIDIFCFDGKYTKKCIYNIVAEVN